MKLFELSDEEFEKVIDNFLNKQTPEQILTELIKCGLDLSVEDKKNKQIEVEYKEITNSNEIKELFNYDKE